MRQVTVRSRLGVGPHAGVGGRTRAARSRPARPRRRTRCERAMAVLKRTAAVLSQAQRFSVTLDIGFDAVQDSGQKIEFGETRQIVLRRPDHLRIDATKRDGAKSTVLFDGKDITVVHPQENVYATVARPGSVDEAIAYFVHDLGMRLPLAELLNSHLAQRLPEQVRVADYVEASSIAGRAL